MKRPQSAKPGHKGYWGQASVDDINDHSNLNIQPNQYRKQVKIMKPDLTTHDFARILPRKIHQDKERLYSQALQLKQNLNEIMQQNVRLKTKISILEKEKDKMNKYMQTAPEGMGVKGNSRLNIYHTKSSEKDNMITRNLKKIVRQVRQQNDLLKIENQKIKKMMKYTKINELEIERKILSDENRRLNALLQEYSSQFINQEDIQKENEELKKYLEEEIEEKNQISEDNQKYEEIIESLEEKIKSDIQKYQNKEKKLLKDLNAEKRRQQQYQRRNQQLNRELKNYRESQQFIQNNKKKLVKPIIRSNKITSQKVHTQMSNVSKQSVNMNSQQERKLSEIKNHNQLLQKQLKQTKQKLKRAEIDINQLKQQNSRLQVKRSEISQKQQQDSEILKKDASKSPHIQSNRNHSKLSHGSQSYEAQIQDEENYDEDFDREEIKEDSHQNNEQILKFRKDFEENQQEEELYKKEDKKDKKSKKKDTSDKKDKKKKKTEKQSPFKPNKKILSEIKEILTYRMKSQRYPFDDLKSDIESAQTNVFTFADLCNMLVNQPFYLTSQYTKVFLSYCYEKQTISPSESIPNSLLVAKLRKMIDDFQLMEESQEKEMIVRIAEMTSTYPRELQVAFQNIKNGEETVAKKDLIQMFKKLELEERYIDLIIAELSLCSDDLEHLNFHGFFERFYIQDENQEYMDNNAIQEQGEESQQSHKHSSRIKKPVSKGNRQNNDLHLDEQELRHDYEDIAEDDGRI